MERFQCRHKAHNSQGLEEKGSHFGKRPQTLESSYRSSLCHHCSVLETGWKPSTPGFWQTPDASATLGGALFNKAQIIDSFSSDMEGAAGHSLSAGMEKSIITDFAKKARSQLITEGNFMAARALDFLVCGAINEPRLLADGSVPNQFFCVRCDQRALATRKHELRKCLGNNLINNTHEGIRAHCDIGAGNCGTQIKFCLPAVCCHVTGHLRATSQNVLRAECGKAWVSISVPVTMFWLPLTDHEAAMTQNSESGRI